MNDDFRIGPADLRRALRTADQITRSGRIGELTVVETELDQGQPVAVTAVLRSAGRDVSVRATVEAAWSAACRRCAESISGTITVDAHEVFAYEAVEGETYPFDGDEIDLSDMVRDTVALDLPLAPAPPEGDDGRCTACGRLWTGQDPNADDDDDPSDADSTADEPVRDPRWAALDQLGDLPDE